MVAPPHDFIEDLAFVSDAHDFKSGGVGGCSFMCPNYPNNISVLRVYLVLTILFVKTGIWTKIRWNYCILNIKNHLKS